MNLKEKTVFGLKVIISALTLLSIFVYSTFLWVVGEPLRAAFGFVVALILTSFVIIVARQNYKEIEEHDEERSRRVRLYAAGYAYLISIFLWLVLMELNSTLGIKEVIGIGILGMLILFGICYMYFSMREVFHETKEQGSLGSL